MELDVELSREEGQPWGFRLIGGTDFKMPLTVVKVLPDSPAERAGLQNGDTVSRIGDTVAEDLSHDDARLIVDEAKMTLQLGVKRGLYDPVLDNYEPIYEDIDQIERADIDQPSQPTEVQDPFQIQQFLDPNKDIFPAKELKDVTNLPESRSLTASPFVLPAKPYRPFSTEPLPEIPPLEDPIILNPNYRDEFGNIIVDDFDELSGGIVNGKYESRFKLPISEQYDPNWEKKDKNVLEKNKKRVELKFTDVVSNSAKEESVHKLEKLEYASEKKEQLIKEDIAFMKKMKQEIDLDKIEITATSIVDESIEKAKIVAEEIQKEIDVELSDVTSLSEAKAVKDSQISFETKSFETSKQETVQKQSEHEDLGIVKRETQIVKDSKEVNEEYDDAKDKTEFRVARKVEKFEAIDIEDHISDERKKSVQKEVEEVIEAGSVSRKSKMFDQEEFNLDTKVKSDVGAEELIESGSVKSKSTMFEKEATVDSKVKSDVDIRRQVKTNVKKQNIETDNFDQKTFETKVSGSKTTSSQAEHRAYTIGLKTIPNIRGTVHSSYHYNLLLQTFFLHLTDVMVALSRFILSEPVFNKAEEKRESVAPQQMSTSASETKTASKRSEDLVKVSESKSSEKRVNKERSIIQNDQSTTVEDKKKANQVCKQSDENKKVEQTQISKSEVKDNVVEIKTHKKAVSGLEMAQLTDKKSEELTVKMDAVISEFENKTGIEETAEHHRRSSSRSQVVEEVMKESDPLEWLSKVNGQKTQEIDLKTTTKTLSSEFNSTVESTSMKTEISNSVISAAERKIESRPSSRARSSTPNKQMYVAVVESHVYTNKDTVLDDQTDISETSSVIEESNISSEFLQTVATQNIAIEKSDKRHDDVSVVIAKQEKAESKTVAAEQKVKEDVTEVRESKLFKNKVKEIMKESKEIVSKSENKVEELYQKSSEIAVEHVKVDTTQSEVIKQDLVSEQVTEPIVELYDNKQAEEITVKSQNLEVDKKETVEIQEIASESMTVQEEHETHGYVELAKEESIAVKEEQTIDLDVSAKIKVDRAEIKPTKPHLESAALKIVKEEVIEVQPSPEILEKEETKILKIDKALDMSKGTVVESESQFIDISSSSSLDSIDLKSKSAIQESTFTAKSISKSESSFTAISESVQESSFIAKLSESNAQKLTATSTSECIQKSSFIAKSAESNAAISISESVQESSFTARSTDSNAQKLTLNTDLAQKSILDSQTSVSGDENNNLDTPTPSTVPVTPVTDEYVFKLQIPLPKTSGKVIPSDLTPEEEDIHIAKKNLVAHIDTTLESPIIYDPPLPSPPGSKVTSPVYTKPGLRGGNMCYSRKEEILEIERKSTLLASAIDETIKSIEEYKEQVGMETKKEEESTITFSSKIENYSKEEKSVSVSKTEVKSKIEDEWSKVEKQVENNNKSLTELSEVSNGDVTTESVVLVNGFSESNGNKLEQRDDKISNGTNGGLTDTVNENIEAIISSDESIQSTNLSKSDMVVDKCITNGINGMHNVITDVRSVAFKEEKEDPMKGFRPVVFNVVTDVGNVAIKEEREESVEEKKEAVEEKEDPMKGFRPVVFNPEPRNPKPTAVYIDLPSQPTGRPYTTPTGELLGTHQGIVDGLEEATVDEEVAKELGKPGMPDDKIAELISGESEMLREAHVMGLTRVLTSHMCRADDSSVDFQKIKPIVDSLRDSEVLKALNEEILKKSKEEKKKDDKKWTTFLQKPKRAVPRAKFGYHGYVQQDEQVIEAPYKPKIVKQPKPKVAPDYKPENFETGPLPWEERALKEPPPPPPDAEDPILVLEEEPEFLEAVDPLPESEVPDLEDTGIPLPPPKSEEETTPPPAPVEEAPEEPPPEEKPEPETVEREKKEKEDMENRIAEQLVSSVQSMVDPNASLEQQLAQMRAQLAALAQLPGVIQQTLEMVSRQLSQICQQESVALQETQQSEVTVEEIQQNQDENEASENHETTITEETTEDVQREEVQASEEPITNGVVQTCLTREEMEKLKMEEEEMLEEQRRIEKQKKEMMERMQDQQSRQVKSHPTPRVGKPKPVFGNGDEPRPLVLPGGRRWRGPKDAYNEQLFAETMSAQAELIQGKALGMSFESDLLPYDSRVNFLKYEKPPVSLDHLQNSDVYKLVHGMDSAPARRVDMLTPVIAEADYREKCRSISPCVGRMQHQDFPQQVQP